MTIGHMMRVPFAVVLTLMFIPTAWSQVCETLDRSSDVGELLTCITDLSGNIAELQNAIAGLEEQKRELQVFIETTLGSGSGLPLGAVVAFNRAGGCPPGWSEVRELAGRFILGAGDGYRYNEIGGEVEVFLTIDDMPAHAHSTVTPDYSFTVNAVGGNRRMLDEAGTGSSMVESDTHTASTGGGAPHNNMPPYIALFWCTPQ